MPRKNPSASRPKPMATRTQGKDFHIELLTTAQKLAWASFQRHDVLFLVGHPGVGKSFVATAFAIKHLLARECEKIVLTRPIVESGESLGFLPGDFEQKVNPYMLPIYDCIDKLVGREGINRERVLSCTEVAPLAYMRGRSFANAVCILDEAQNATMKQLKMFLSRFETGSKLIITGDPSQSDLIGPTVDLVEVVQRLAPLAGIGIVEFKANSNVRHPLVAEMMSCLEEPASRGAAEESRPRPLAITRNGDGPERETPA